MLQQHPERRSRWIEVVDDAEAVCEGRPLPDEKAKAALERLSSWITQARAADELT